jgi:uncharacterized protein YidB (DUF937 family)
MHPNKEVIMGLFDQLKEQLAQSIGGGSDLNNLFEHAIGIINNPATGGFTGFIDTLKNKGLGNLVASWIDIGENKPISADQILQVLGPERIQQIAQKVGMSQEELSQHLSMYLPQIIDKLTPNGKLPDASILEDGLNMLKKNFLDK